MVPAADAVVSVSSEVALRGANVFEGVRSYGAPANADRPRAAVALGAHLDRMFASADLLAIGHRFDHASFGRAIAAVVEANGYGPGDDLYVRPSILVEGGRLPEDDGYRSVDYVAVAGVPRTSLTDPQTAVVSSHPRSARSTLPPEAKAGGSYLGFRLPLAERRRAGADAVVVLNEHGRVAEAEGAAVCVVRDGVVASPPTSEGCLRSITLAIVGDIARGLGAGVEARPLALDELASAEAVFLAGTLSELTPLSRVGAAELGSARHPLYREIAGRFDELRSGAGPLAGRWLEPLATPAGARG